MTLLSEDLHDAVLARLGEFEEKGENPGWSKLKQQYKADSRACEDGQMDCPEDVLILIDQVISSHISRYKYDATADSLLLMLIRRARAQ